MIINDGEKMRGVRFKNRSKVEWFKVFAKNCYGNGKFKVRIMEYQDT